MTRVNRHLDLARKLRAERKRRKALQAFAQDVLEGWHERSLDGGDLQELGEKHGLLEPKEVRRPCGEQCACAEYGGFPTTCYRNTKILTAR